MRQNGLVAWALSKSSMQTLFYCVGPNRLRPRGLSNSNPFKFFSSVVISFEPFQFSRFFEDRADAGDPRHAPAAHARLLKLHDSVGSSFSPWNKLLRLYLGSGLYRQAHQLFDRIPSRDVVSYNTLFSARTHGRSKMDAGDALRLYCRMLWEGIRPDHITLSMLIAGEIARELVEQMHAQTIKFGLNSNAFVGGALVNSYERCRGLDEAIRTFEEIDELDSVSWNIMIDACARARSKWHAVEVFSRMRKEGGGSFDCFAVTSLLKTCLDREDLSLGMQLHGCSWKVGLVTETPIGNAIITMYSKCGGLVSNAIQVFHMISKPNTISWTAMISGLMQNGMGEEAARIYNEMIRSGGIENEFCAASAVAAFSILASLEYGRMIHSRIIKLECSSDTIVGNALINMYFKCGSAEDAYLAFQTMPIHDVVSWTIIILGFGQHGRGREALEIFQSMGKKGASPNSTTFLAVLTACSHGGLLDDGLRFFRSMVNDHHIDPRREHCACIVDMLGRAGRLNEAEMFIRESGIEMDSFSWEALLGACKVHGVIGLGETSAKKIMALEPHKDGPHVLLSNIYAEKRMWEKKEKLREMLDASARVKETGSSWFLGPKF